MTIRYNMESIYNADIDDGLVIDPTWGDDVNINLDDKVSQSDTTSQAMLSHLIFTTSKFPQMGSDPSADNDAVRKSWADTQHDDRIRKSDTSNQAMASNLALASTKYITVNNGKVLARWDEDNPVSSVRYLSWHGSIIAAADYNDDGWVYDGSFVWAELAVAGTAMRVDLEFPDGITLTYFGVEMQEGGTRVLSVTFVKHTMGSSTVTTIGSIMSSTSTMTFISASVTDEEIDNSLYSYYIVVSPGGGTDDIRIRHIKASYTTKRPY